MGVSKLARRYTSGALRCAARAACCALRAGRGAMRVECYASGVSSGASSEWFALLRRTVVAGRYTSGAPLGRRVVLFAGWARPHAGGMRRERGVKRAVSVAARYCRSRALRGRGATRARCYAPIVSENCYVAVCSVGGVDRRISPHYYPSKCSESRAESVPLVRTAARGTFLVRP